MKPEDVQQFFQELDRRIEFPVQVILTGGAAAILRGAGRATYDIDFQIRFKNPRQNSPAHWEALQAALADTGKATGISPQYDENIDRWSTIPMPTKKSRRYARWGQVEVLLLDPGLWAIGKLTRYIGSDVDDLRRVLKSARTRPRTLVRLWGAALGMSPASNMQAVFRRQVESFIDAYAREIWGATQNPAALKQLFRATAQQARAKKIRQRAT